MVEGTLCPDSEWMWALCTWLAGCAESNQECECVLWNNGSRYWTNHSCLLELGLVVSINSISQNIPTGRAWCIGSGRNWICTTTDQLAACPARVVGGGNVWLFIIHELSTETTALHSSIKRTNINKMCSRPRTNCKKQTSPQRWWFFLTSTIIDRNIIRF